MTIRPTEDFVRAAAENGITKWTINTCSFCGYPCGFVIQDEAVFYDSGCYCSSGGPSPLRLVAWAEVAEHYNRNQPERNERITQQWADEVDAFWRFTTTSP